MKRERIDRFLRWSLFMGACYSVTLVISDQQAPPPGAATPQTPAAPAGERGRGRGAQDEGRVVGPNGEVWGFTNLG